LGGCKQRYCREGSLTSPKVRCHCAVRHERLQTVTEFVRACSLSEQFLSKFPWLSLQGAARIDREVHDQESHEWELLLEKFTLDWMVSGYILLAAALYQITTHDDRYSKKGSMEFVITDNAIYMYDLPSIADAVFRNMDENPYNLYPCGPNRISGIVASGKVLGNKYGDKLKSRFEAALASEFSNADGTILPVRSELTGFTIPGVAGAISDVAPSVYCRPYLPHVAHRHWAIMKRENLRWTADGYLELCNLIGADNIDPGNYKAGKGFVCAAMASVASEYGDYRIRDELIRQVDEERFQEQVPFCYRAG
ncbi:hypothetical protein EK21DRAFT_95409, partial [Setomelanomma holmii]